MKNLHSQVRLQGVSKAYGPHVVLSKCDLAIESGEFVVVIGCSGSGKSTLLNLIGGLDQPASGSIEIMGEELTGLGEEELSKLRHRRLGFVFQFFNLIPTLTVAENIQLPMALNDIPKQESRERAHVLLTELGLAGCDDRFPEELSGGEQQRVAIARAIAHEPAIVLADEPTGNLDIETAKEVLELLNDVCRRREATLIMATHSREVIGLADRVLTIRGSHLEESG